MKKIIDFLLKPFKENLPFLFCLCILASGADAFFRMKYGGAVFGFYMALHGFIECYFIVLLTGFLKGKSEKIVRGILLLAGVINLVMDTCVYSITHVGFSFDTVCLILGTNANEATEFVPMYLTPKVILFSLACFTIVALLLIFGDNIVRKLPRVITYILVVTLLGGIAYTTYRHSKNWETVFLGKIGLFLSYEKPEDLSKYRTTPEIVKLGEGPDNIVLIIGESLARSHCSLYGYEKQTQPNLEAMRDSSLIYVYTDVTSPWINTIPSFKAILSTYEMSMGENKKWYDCTFLHDIMKAAGYRSYWISNQASKGLYDNETARLAELSDTVIWAGDKSKGFVGRTDKDENLIPIIHSITQQPEIIHGKNFFLVNLMGSHESFENRYPKEYARYSSDDYLHYPESQRITRSDYDNTVYYNDYVVKELFHQFDKTDAIVYYFPDHSIDIYASDPTYAGHARPTDPVSYKEGTEIPFIVYPTESFKARHPERLQEIAIATEEEFCTENIIESLTKLMEISFTN